MPWASKQQAAWGHTKEGEEALGGADKVAEWDAATPKGSLPDKVAEWDAATPKGSLPDKVAEWDAATPKGSLPDKVEKKEPTHKPSYYKRKEK